MSSPSGRGKRLARIPKYQGPIQKQGKMSPVNDRVGPEKSMAEEQQNTNQVNEKENVEEEPQDVVQAPEMQDDVSAEAQDGATVEAQDGASVEADGIEEAASPEVEDTASHALKSAVDKAGNVVRIVAEAVENVAADAIERVAETLHTGEHDEAKELTSVGAEGLQHTGDSLGFTGEIVGRVVKLEDLEKGDDEEHRATYDQLRSLIEQTLTNVSENEIVRGRVVSIGDKDIVIDIGFKSDGIVPRNEFNRELEPGEEVEVFLERIEDYQGQLVLSKTKADTVRRWQRIEDAYKNEEVLDGTIVRRIKGGMIVELFDGVEAFLPGSQIDVRPVRDFDAYLEKRMEFKIVKLNPANENIVVSHKALIEKELESQRKKILSTMEPGQVLEGTVKNITDFGVFIDLGGVDGLLHITDLSWGRVSHPSELVSLDEKLNVVVLDYDKERQRISLGLKQLQPHPWDNIGEKYHEGETVEGKVVSITDYGAFVELEKGIEGLVHISEMSWTEHIRHPSQMVALGQVVPVKILNIDHEGKKISLGMKQLQPDPWEGIAARYPAGTVLRGRVRNITNFGVFVEIEPGIDGLVHISDLSWTKRVKHPSEIVKKGQELDVVVLNIDEKERRISLGHKQVETNPWNQFAKVYAEGIDTEGKIASVEEKGIVVDLPLDVEAFVPAGEMKNAPENYHAGDSLNIRIIRFDANNKEIIGSETAKQRAEERAVREQEEKERRVERDRERRDVQDFTERQPAATGPTTLGELSGLSALRDQMRASEVATEAQPSPKEGEELVVTPQANLDLTGAPGSDNRKAGEEAWEGTEADRSATEPPVEQQQRKEEAGDVTPAEMSQAAFKDAGETDKEGAAAAAELLTEDVTPSEGTGDKPIASLEEEESVPEVESFTRPKKGSKRKVTTSDVVAEETDEEEASADTEMGKASATVKAESQDDADDVADRA
ncbi:MAG TPA: 30S ribosomal protein S1 [Rhodothermales bacterium]|nr:30S ribosomal protein S1 [Rhodothermales bacterium]